MNLRLVDLNLLHVFDAVMKHRSVAQAAERLSLSPSAVSHGLSRLRHALKDELFLRDETGMRPTPRALELAAPVRGSLALLERAFARSEFAPAESMRTFRLAAGDYVCALILPRLVHRIAKTAPHIDLKIVPASRLDISRQLDGGMVDLVFGWFDTLPPALRRKILVRENGVLVVRQGHPLAQEPVTVERLFDFPHAVVDLTAAETLRGDGFLDDSGMVRRVWMERAVLQARERPDLSARVAVSVPHFSALPPLLRMSDLVATLPARLAEQEVARGGLAMLDPSLEPGSIDLEAVWHSRSEADAGLIWLMGELVNACAELDRGVPTDGLVGR